MQQNVVRPLYLVPSKSVGALTVMTQIRVYIEVKANLVFTCMQVCMRDMYRMNDV